MMPTQDRPQEAATALSPGPGTPTHPIEHSQRLRAAWRGWRVRVTITSLIARIRVRTWVAAFELEEARHGYAAHRHYMRSAGCCIALSVLRLPRWLA